MSYIVKDVIDTMRKLAPESYAEHWDNSGFNLGSLSQTVNKIMVTLTITSELADKAVSEQVDLIISHHPLIFKGITAIRTDQYQGALIAKLLNNNISVYCSHTNLDRSPRGLNHWLANMLDLKDQIVLDPDFSDASIGLGRVGTIPAVKLGVLVEEIEKMFRTKVRTVGNKDQICSKVAICGGSGGSFISLAKTHNADVLITGDIKYHEALDAQELGLALIDAGHFATEKVMIDKVSEYLFAEFPEIKILKGSEGDNPFWY